MIEKMFSSINVTPVYNINYSINYDIYLQKAPVQSSHKVMYSNCSSRIFESLPLALMAMSDSLSELVCAGNASSDYTGQHISRWD